MRALIFYAYLLTGLFYFSEGKPCPEKSRPHKTRCDAFYKCRELPSNSHVWVPVKCNKGLVYEHNVGSCVLPGDDWECLTPSEMSSSTIKSDILIVNNRDEAELRLSDNDKDDNVQIVLDSTLSSEEQDDTVPHSKSAAETDHVLIAPNLIGEDEVASVSQFDSSGDGELVELDGQSLPQTREGEAQLSTKSALAAMMSSTSRPAASSASPIDPDLTAHLQRLSQLIDGLQQTYQNSDKSQVEMRPDQLNAFLAHFDLKNRYDMFNPQGDYKNAAVASTTAKPPPSTTQATVATTKSPDSLPEPTANKTLLQEHLTKHRMQPETKLMLSNTQPFSSYGPGYANSQIVVNRPEGSVMFTLPQYGHSAEQQQAPPQQMQQPFSTASSIDFNEHQPKISEETLKTVLELSKQMIAAQNLPKVLPNPAYNSAYYAPPILQPLIISPHNNPFQQYYQMPSYDVQQPPRTHYMHHKKNSYNKKQQQQQQPQPSTTIIHNNVIPVHLSSTNSGEKEVLDTYGNSLGVYPSLDKHGMSSSTVSSTSSNKNSIQMDSNNYYNKFIATMTTARPSSTISVTTMSNQYTGQYAAPYANDYVHTTPSPFAVHPSPATVATYYTPSPHLNENNVNSIFQADNSYPTGMGQSSMPGMFPSQLEPGQVKIRPNSQKIESMEVEADEAINANYINSNGNSNLNNNNNNNNNRLNSPHVLTYSSAVGSSSADMMGMSHQLAPATYVEHSYTMSQNAPTSSEQQQMPQQQMPQHHHQFKAPYLPRPTPTMSSSIYSDTAGNVGLSMFSTGMGHVTGPGSSQSNLPSMPAMPSLPAMPSKSKYPGGMGQLVNFNGNFISLDVFQKSILPLMTQSSSAMSELGNVEVITCQAGVRQPNQTDCTRYFVCSKKDGKVLSYSCPPYTGFNQQTRICDASTYAQCGNMPQFNGYSIDENRRQQMETLKLLAEAKRRQEAAIKAQNIANLLQQYGSSSAQENMVHTASGSMENHMMDSYMMQMSEPSSTLRPIMPAPTMTPIISSTISTFSNSLSSSGSSSSSSSGSGSVKKRKYYCREGDKIPDQTSISSYFVCYKTAEGQMKGHKMTCSKSLVFCPKTLMCTLASKCTG
ncbi:uncharacterized protein LOC133850605 [Drosophila sulfurigaster albostrigata]|uniref:uncharacterized protein LOC133850605 n=1 Tax=Drosophila sulfurigaster albostrigata TaxID=89887 RepID=UPI002D21BAD3|nr:uncharacterized protein LOC133850605 [Drosophila sulfurigaster albostrigata]